MLRLVYPLVMTALCGLPWRAPAHEAAMSVHHIPMPGADPDGTPSLPMANRVATWARRAGLEVRWEPVPFKRSLQALQQNQSPLCVLGLFDTPERRQFARFSVPIHQEEQQVFITARRTAAALRAQPDARSALLSPHLQLLVFDGVAYGAPLDAWIAERRPPPVRATAGTSNLATMLARGHADFTISVASELRELKARGQPDAQRLEIVHLPGMPAPPQRHLACSLKVPAAWLQRFDAAVRAHPLP
jgi:polar amino acid transport system substrate-binding protein